MSPARRRAALIRDRWGHGARLGLVVGIGLLLVRIAFALIVPVGEAPDEASHFIKAYASVRFDLGTTDDVPIVAQPTDMDRLNQSLGAVYDLGGQAVNPTWACNSIRRDLPASCLDLDAEQFPGPTATTPFGAFQPYLYAVIGLPTLVIDDPDTAMLAMRVLIALWSSALVTAALMLIVRRFGAATMFAATVGLTPMVIYTQGTLGTTGIETAAAFAVLVAGLDVVWDRDRCPRSSRWVLLVATACLVLCRPLSVLVAAVIALIIGLAVGGRELVTRARALPRGFRRALGAVAVIGTMANLAWSAATADVYRGRDVGLLSTFGSYVLDTAPLLWREVIGLFEWLDTELPFLVLFGAWTAIVVVVIGVFPDRDRVSALRLWMLIAVTIAVGFVIDYTLFARVGGDVQGRHVLPLFQLWTLVAAIPNRGARATPELSGARQRRVRGCLLAAGAALGISVLYVARREAVGTEGPLLFFGEAAWHPQAGWVVPFGIAAVGLALAFALPALFGSMHEHDPSTERPT